jgi:hypothetical protein
MGVSVVPVTYFWDSDDKRAVCYHYESRWTWEEFYVVLEESRKLWDEVNHTVDVIVDFTHSSGFPSGNILGHFRNITAYYNDPKAGNTVIIGANDFFRMASELFNKVYIRQRQKPVGNTFLVKDIEAGRAILAEYRKKAINNS